MRANIARRLKRATVVSPLGRAFTLVSYLPVIEDFDNPISPVVLEQFPFPGVPEGAYTFLSLALNKPEGYFTYDVVKQTARFILD